MPKIQLTGGSYPSRDQIESSQRTVNLYPEQMAQEQGEPSSVTYLQTPGLVEWAVSPTDEPCRCLYRATNGDLYAVFGKDVFWIDKKKNFTKLGSFKENQRTPVIMTDNGTHVLMCDGSTITGLLEGFTVDMKKHDKIEIIAATGWLGSTYLDFTDTFVIANYPGTPTFYISGSEDITFDPLDFAGKSAKADPLIAAIVSHRVIWLIGTTETEIFYNTGGGGLGTTNSGNQTNTFPFEIMPGVSTEDGACATYSITKLDTNVFWLAQSPSGGRYMIMGAGYKTSRISNHAMEHIWNTYSRVDDAISWTYNQEGHYFLVINFPTADTTWVYDLYTKLWHQRIWLDIDGNEHRHRAAYHAFVFDQHLVGDWESGAIYTLDLDTYTDAGSPIKRVRTFPQQIDPQSNSRIRYNSFTAEISVGQNLDPNTDSSISLSWSDDGGHTWSNKVRQTLGKTGSYKTNINWNRLGMGRDRTWQLEWSAPFKVSLQGAFVDFAVLNS